MMKYKCSQFNYIQENEKDILIYNTLYNSLVRLNREEYEMYLGEKNIDDWLRDEFIDNGLWIENDINEYSKYLAFTKAYTVFASRPLSITITTTLKCNARCAYCYEKGVQQVDIIDDAEEKIINFIKKNMIQNNVHLVWFGGEPLMNIAFMDSLSMRLREENINYASYIITNGSLLTDTIITEKFKLWNVMDMQITLDGSKGNYEKRKRYINPEDGEYYKILNTIRAVAMADVFINIRLNIEKNNRKDMIELLQELDSIFASYNNVVFYPAFITDTKHPMTEQEKIQCVKEMLLSVKNVKKLTTSTKMYSLPRMHACMKGDPRSFTIDVNGYIYTCEHYVGRTENAIGSIWKEEMIGDRRGENIKIRDKCEKCVFLPKCYGGCESNYLNDEDPCMIEKYLIKAYLEIL